MVMWLWLRIHVQDALREHGRVKREDEELFGWLPLCFSFLFFPGYLVIEIPKEVLHICYYLSTVA